jgi:hypothetical protein
LITRAEEKPETGITAYWLPDDLNMMKAKCTAIMSECAMTRTAATIANLFNSNYATGLRSQQS